MLGNPGSYANKKRKKPVLKHKKVSDGNEVVKTNPSKRHRDRLNGELDRLTDLLPFEGEVRTRLDKLSVLRLSVGYLRVKSYFKATMKNSSSSLMFSGVNGQNGNSMDTASFSEGDLLLQALNGFVMVVTSEGSVFYVSSTIKDYLGFHQSDVVHQSVFELIHTDDRALFRQQLHFALNPTSDGTDGNVLKSCGSTVMYSPEQLPPENSSFLERSFVCRFRCLLDNSSGFLALKFQGRLKYLHGQRVLNRDCNKSQLALFAIAMPVQPPTIVEIRAKMLLYQTKHQLDFTPMAVDSRGKIILGYSETELCMKGSGYQFIHAADMMYCADNHIRMIKTGESGLTVFRLLSKSRGWVWVKSNAKLIYKGGRPEFIIAYQRALSNAEGEEYLRQRRLQLPFNLTTGEGILYNNDTTVDLQQFQFNKMFSNVNKMKEDVTPGSLLDSFLSQDETAYMPRTVDTPLPVDQVFMDSQALVSIASDSWQDDGTTATTSDPVVVKEEAKQSVMAVIDNLEQMAQNGDFCAALQNLDVGDAELMEWNNALKRLSQDHDQQSNVRSELDSILTNDIFDYIDSVLFKEKGEDCVNGSPPSCLTAVNNNEQDPIAQAARLSATGLGDPQLFQTSSPNRTYSPMNGLYNHQQDTMTGPAIAGRSLVESTQIFNSTQKLSHGPLITPVDTNLPPLQQLQLQDIFSPSIELPELTVPDTSAPFQSCGQTSISQMGCPQGTSAQIRSNRLLQSLQNNVQAPAIAANGQLLQSSIQQPNNVAPGIIDILPALIPCSDFNSTSAPNVPNPFATTCLQGSPSFVTHNHQVQQWPQSHRQELPHTGIMQNGQKLMPACHSLTPESQTFPHAAGLWPRDVTGLNPIQQHGVLNATQQHGGLNPTQQHGGLNPTQQHGGLNATQQHGRLNPTQQHGGLNPTQQHGRLNPTQQHGGLNPTQQHGGLNPTQQHGGLNPTQQHGGLTCGQAATHSSCMFNQHFSSGPAGGDVLAQLGPPGPLRGGEVSLDESPPQGSCYFQWSHSESVVGTSAINQENVNISPLTAPPNMPATEHTLNIQHYLEYQRHTQQGGRVSAESNGMFNAPALDVAAVYLTK